MVKNVFLIVIHIWVRFILNLFRVGGKLTVNGDAGGRPRIYVANHRGIEDILTALRIIKKHCYVLVSDNDRYNINGLALRFNGVIWIDRADRTDRRRAYSDLVRHLKAGHSVLMYPEAAWNFTPGVPVLPCFSGAIRASAETGVPIVPMYLDFDGGECRAMLGEAYQVDQYCGEQSERELTEDMRCRMISLFYDILDQKPLVSRTSIAPDHHERDVLARCRAYSVAKKDPDAYIRNESRFLYVPKDLVTPSEAFAHLAELSPSLNNAFLFDKRLSRCDLIPLPGERK